MALKLAVTEEPLSDIHWMLGQIRRERTADRINGIVNHPSIYPFVRGSAEGPLDLTDPIANEANVCLMGKHGGVFFEKLIGGMYEAHTQILPEGRGQWAIDMVRACLHWMFTRTDAMEIITRCPTRASKALAVSIGGKFEFRAERGYLLGSRWVPADIYALRIHDWFRGAPGLEERGHWFHEFLEAEYRRLRAKDPLPHPEDPVHDRYVGLAAEMILGKQVNKAVLFYNRWALFAGYLPIEVVSADPVTIDIRDALLVVRPNGTFYVASLAGSKLRSVH